MYNLIILLTQVIFLLYSIVVGSHCYLCYREYFQGSLSCAVTRGCYWNHISSSCVGMFIMLPRFIVVCSHSHVLLEPYLIGMFIMPPRFIVVGSHSQVLPEPVLIVVGSHLMVLPENIQPLKFVQSHTHKIVHVTYNHIDNFLHNCA